MTTSGTRRFYQRDVFDLAFKSSRFDELWRPGGGCAAGNGKDVAVSPDLLAWLARDLLRPVSAIRALADELDPAMMQRLRAEVDRLARMVDDLVELSSAPPPASVRAGAVEFSLAYTP
jgi:hypothetical protein